MQTQCSIDLLIPYKQKTSKYLIEDFLVNHIFSHIVIIVFSFSDGKHQMIRGTNSRHCNVQLTMSKAVVKQPNTNILKEKFSCISVSVSIAHLKGLTLGFVYGHGKSYSDRKLPSGPFKWKFSVLRFQSYSGNQYLSVAKLPSNNDALQKVVTMHLFKN